MIQLLGWTVDMQPCAAHGGIGVGMNFYVELENGTVTNLWWCSVDDLNDFLRDDRPRGGGAKWARR